MAADPCHAAGQPTYEVHEGLEGDLTFDLGVRHETADFGAALDFAFDLLETCDPRREGAVSALEIVRVDGCERETVWRYVYSDSRSASRDLVGVWGFDVTRSWQSHYRPPTARR